MNQKKTKQFYHKISIIPTTTMYLYQLFVYRHKFPFFRKVLCKDIDNAHSMCDPNYGLTIERCGGEGEAGCGLVALFFTGPYLLFGGAIIALLYIASTVLGVQWLIA